MAISLNMSERLRLLVDKNPDVYQNIEYINIYYEQIIKALNLGETHTLLDLVDTYHKHTFLVLSGSGANLAVIKLINNKSWDNSKEMIDRDLHIGLYVQNIISKLIAREPVFYSFDDKSNQGILSFSYIGSANTYITEKSYFERNNLCLQAYPLLYELHSKTISNIYGFGNLPKLKLMTDIKEHAEFVTFFILRDIAREKLDTSGELNTLIKEKWYPVFNSQMQFSLTHRDITFSNILNLTSGGITFIDWTYSLWSDPNYDLANLFFWQVKDSFNEENVETYGRLFETYKKINYDISRTFPYFLGRKYIDFGRFRGENYRITGSKLLSCNAMSEVFSILKSQ